MTKKKPPNECEWEELKLYDRCTCNEYNWEEQPCSYMEELHNKQCFCTCCPHHIRECMEDI